VAKGDFGAQCRKKIEMNLALADCNDPNAITRDASTPSSNGKVGATTSLEREKLEAPH
jgi:hypothetical protein